MAPRRPRRNPETSPTLRVMNLRVIAPLAAIIALFALGFAFRTAWIAGHGLVDDDMAYYAIFADYYRRLIFDGAPMYFGLDIAYKPAFMLLSFVIVSVIGLTEYTLPLLNAVLGLGVAYYAMRIARLAGASTTGAVLVAAMTLFMPFLIQLDRFGLSHTGATLILLAGIERLLLWGRYPWAGPRRLLKSGGLLLGLAFLFHPTVLLFVLVEGLLVTWREVRLKVRPWRERIGDLVAFGGFAALPLLAVDVLYRILFLVWPNLTSGREETWIGMGYFGDVLNALAWASISGEGTRDPLFLWHAFGFFEPRLAGHAMAPITLAAALFGLYVARRQRSATLGWICMLALAPLSLMAFNPQVGQLARASHASIPLLLVLIALGAERLGGWLETHGVASSRLLIALVLGASMLLQAGLWLERRVDHTQKPGFIYEEHNLPRILLADLKATGTDKIYVYYSGWYGLHWFYYLHDYFGAEPFTIQNTLQPEPDNRMILTPMQLEQKVREGKADVVIMRRMPDRHARLWGGRGKEEDFLNVARALGGEPQDGVGRLNPLPPVLHVYDFRNCGCRRP